MKVFVTSDIHGRIEVFHKIVTFVKGKEDIQCIILCGDISGDHTVQSMKELGIKQKEECEKFKLLLKYVNKELIYVLGNNDIFDVEISDTAYLPNCNKGDYKNFVAIEYTSSLFENPINYESEDNIKERLNRLYINEESIVVSHVPPYKCLDNIKNGMNFGSIALRELIEEKKPAFFFCGHVHYAFGVEKLYDTLVFNTACDETTARGWIVDLETHCYEKVIL